LNNPLLSEFNTPFESAPFSAIKIEHYIPAIKKAIDVALQEIDAIANQEETPTFKNTLEQLEKCGKLIGRNSSLLFNLNSAETSDELQQTTQQASPLLTQFQNDIRLNEKLFKRIEAVYQNEDRSELTQEQITLLEKEYKRFVRNGANLPLDYPSYVPFMTYAENRRLRKQFSIAFGQRGYQENPQNNSGVILKIIQLRKERAELLGYQSHAAFVLEERMAQSEVNVKKFLDELTDKAKPAATKEWETMQAFAAQHLELKELEKWDTTFVSEKLKQATLDLDEQELKPYFPLENVLKGLFDIVGKLYGIELLENKEIDTYHPDVKVYEVHKNGAFHALLYADFFPRPGKRNGAWMTSYRSQNATQRPHISIVCNFSKPTQNQPSLLTFQEVTTLFHEFGHALHGMLADTTYSSLSGTSVFWDFVELPSQIMENWCYQAEALALYAKHYQTGEVIPNELIEKIKKAAHFQQGLQTLRQLSFGYLDLSYHDQNADQIQNVKAHEGYYSYKWAEVLDADAFELFLENGIFDSKTAASFLDNILSKGGTIHPMTLYKKFRGKEPDPSALLRRAGLA